MRFPYLPDILIQTLPSSKFGYFHGKSQGSNSLSRALLEITYILENALESSKVSLRFWIVLEIALILTIGTVLEG
jgi:hypothetical protein